MFLFKVISVKNILQGTVIIIYSYFEVTHVFVEGRWHQNKQLNCPRHIGKSDLRLMDTCAPSC